jgi:hypothetical protein
MSRRRKQHMQTQLPGMVLPEGDRNRTSAKKRIPHHLILESFAETLGPSHIVQIYRQHVLPVQTRTMILLGRKNQSKIINTLLGYEVQSSYKRIHCPDLVTARYLKVFSDLGCRRIRLPYDPTVTAEILPDLEWAMNRITSGVRDLFPLSRDTQIYVLQRLFSIIRSELSTER